MQIEFILLAVIFSYLRNFLKKNNQQPEWQRLFLAGLVFSIAMLFVEMTNSGLRPVTVWIAHTLTIALIYMVLTRSEFQPVKSKLYIILPLLIVNFTEDLAKLISGDYYHNIRNYFQTAGLFAVIWLVTMMIISNKQKKALEKEQIKAAEREKEFKITERIKAQLEIEVAERTTALTLKKEELEQTIHDLKATQSQLIQSEKMASLGELTAGIAHEIQNPLNFVNNFAEVNADIIEDIKIELEAGNASEAIALAKDLKSNNEKIAHHGKRADSIIKGMLQHSRSSGGVKEPTDINKLADEYLRLAYHGLRAKDKSFNATLKTDYDESIGNINVIPQDIGRAILNLITNAFYAVTEKKKTLPSPVRTPVIPGGPARVEEPTPKAYEPVVTVTTKKTFFPSGDAAITISVVDNGNGIPQKVLDKVFQPFFTTKPTGQGTGLGLSLSYDIVKAHGGEINVRTKEGEGTEFSIQLKA